MVPYGLRSHGLIEVSSPLKGTSERWSKVRFEAMGTNCPGGVTWTVTYGG